MKNPFFQLENTFWVFAKNPKTHNPKTEVLASLN
jgi:hypothetical protein